MFSTDGDRELTVPDGRANSKINLLDHVLWHDEVVNITIITDSREILMDSVLEMNLFKIIGGPPDGGGSLPSACLEASGMIILDSEYDNFRLLIFRVGTSISESV